jgi:hypothetical protein
VALDVASEARFNAYHRPDAKSDGCGGIPRVHVGPVDDCQLIALKIIGRTADAGGEQAFDVVALLAEQVGIHVVAPT